jgi:beta-1,4-mannosyltransferase
MKKIPRVWAFPMTGSYTSPLYKRLSEYRIEIKEGTWSFSWLMKNLQAGDIVHLHWPSFAYSTTKSKLIATVSFLKFFIFLMIIRFLGVRIWWTAHNLLPHDRNIIRNFDIFARHLVIFYSQFIFVHGEFARKQLEERFPQSIKKNIEIPHGNWIDYYGPAVEKHYARNTLSLPINKFVLLIFGQLRAYKNIHVLIDFLQKKENTDIYLLIAGQFKDDAYKNKIIKLLKTEIPNPSIRLDAKFIPNDEVPLYLAASDIMIMPYKEILTSGTAMLAISYGCPIMSIKAGFLIDVISPDTGIFIEDMTEIEIDKAIVAAQKTNWATEKIIEHAKTFTFDDAATIMFNKLN